MKNSPARTCLALAALAATLPACKTLEEREPPPKPLVGTRWEVILELPVNGEQPWIRMGDGRMEGYGGCNRINARYIRDTVGARAIAMGVISAGRRSCDESNLSAERRVVEVLQAVSSYSITADAMSMTGSAGTLRFRAVSDMAGGGIVDLANTRWVAVGMNAQKWLPTGNDREQLGNAPRLEFGGDGRVTGYTGCNNLNGTYKLSGDRLEMVVATTKRACAGPGGEFEGVLAGILIDSPRVSLNGRNIVITGAKGAKVEFQPTVER
ncbi:META domain-containing protein [Usitatibacter palustris]|uniref:DUF306 domain-containing protein n=1 Tax=Usitatibacter palustris TaxID=2732487 RepID=A0A6M4H8B7_9PROT|nr:META domain-containing protein [Usitatibacter palustris]QJR15831.1 hypothetical protein DSM104440_02657 [Usitatibacter palustris]